MHEYAHGVIERELPASGERLPPQWALQDPEDYLDVLREAVPGGRRRGRRRARRRSSASPPTSPPRRRCRCCADGTPLCRCDELASARTPTRSCGSTTPRSAQADRINARRRASAASRGWRATAGASPPSGSSPRRCRCSRRTPRSTSAWSAGSRRADWIVWQLCGRETRNACTAGYKGDPPGRRLPVRGLPARARRALRRLRRRQARRPARRRSARAPAA